MRKGKKISKLQIIRILIQIAFFILVPGLYASAFSGIKRIYTGVLDQSFSFSGYWPQLIEAIAVIPVTILLGRFFCGWMCAFGSLGDLLHQLSSKVFKVNFKIDEKADRILKYLKYVILGFIIIVIWSFDVSSFSSANPWNVFGLLATVGKLPDFSDAVTQYTLGLLLLLAIMTASFFIERFFCRYLCPLGAVFAIVSRLRFMKIKKPNDKCGACRVCTKGCPMGIPLYKYSKVASGECIHCLKCVSDCPHNNVSVSVADADVRPVIAGALAVTIISGFYYGGSFAASSSMNAGSSAAASSTQESGNKLYKDGAYEGSGQGFRGATTTVKVTLKNDKMTNIEVVSFGDDGPYFNAAYSTVVNEILSKQSAEVDACSGATFSSMGIMSAVAEALDKAGL